MVNFLWSRGTLSFKDPSVSIGHFLFQRYRSDSAWFSFDSLRIKFPSATAEGCSVSSPVHVTLKIADVEINFIFSDIFSFKSSQDFHSRAEEGLGLLSFQSIKKVMKTSYKIKPQCYCWIPDLWLFFPIEIAPAIFHKRRQTFKPFWIIDTI